LSRKQLREGMTGANPKATGEAWREWLEELDGKPNTYCSGNVLEIPIGATPEEEVERRRVVAKRCIDAITESDAMPKEERDAFVKEKMAEIERDYA